MGAFSLPVFLSLSQKFGLFCCWRQGVEMLVHFSQISWNKARWPNFSPEEFACRCCGVLNVCPDDFDAIQAVRYGLGRAIRLNSAYRCGIHNARVGGAPFSQHKRMAFDIDLDGHDQRDLLNICHLSGFTGFGFYSSFLHVDRGPSRTWATKSGRLKWIGLT